MIIPARHKKGRPVKTGGEYVRGVYKLTDKEYLALNQLYPDKEVMAFPDSPDGRRLAKLYKMGYVERTACVDLNGGRESLAYRISEDGLLRLLNPNLLHVQIAMEK
jgi:hypothetical protein